MWNKNFTIERHLSGGRSLYVTGDGKPGLDTEYSLRQVVANFSATPEAEAMCDNLIGTIARMGGTVYDYNLGNYVAGSLDQITMVPA